jgi:hypothetical protein
VWKQACLMWTRVALSLSAAARVGKVKPPAKGFLSPGLHDSGQQSLDNLLKPLLLRLPSVIDTLPVPGLLSPGQHDPIFLSDLLPRCVMNCGAFFLRLLPPSAPAPRSGHSPE